MNYVLVDVVGELVFGGVVSSEAFLECDSIIAFGRSTNNFWANFCSGWFGIWATSCKIFSFGATCSDPSSSDKMLVFRS